jgi:hypothetical protein
MTRLWYIFWAMPLFFAGCANHANDYVLQYRPEFLIQETATARPPSAIFDPPYLADTDAFGRDEIAGVNLNHRTVPQSIRGYNLGEIESYQYYYTDYGPGNGCGGCGSGYGWGGGPSSTLYYYRAGTMVP